MIPKVVIVGRPNVGKSSLLNMLAGKRVSIVDATPGVTRDRISVTMQLTRDDPARTAELIDTGGHGIVDSQDLTAKVERQIAVGVKEADLLIFTIDAQSGILPLDHQVAQLLRESAGGTPVLLVANKVDDQSHENDAIEATQLGFGDPVCVSAANTYNKFNFVRAIVDRIDWDRPPHDKDVSADPGVLIAIVGKRNAGKSTLINALAGTQRVIVSEIAGTTRDAVDVRFEYGEKVITAIDTAGLRKRKSMKTDIEYYSHHRALLSIRRADVVLMLVDASVASSQVDSKLADEIVRHHKPCMIVVNKWDLAEQQSTQEQYLDYLDKALRGLSFAPIAFISAVKDEGLGALMAMAMNLYQQAGHRVGTGRLNRVIEKILTEQTPISKVGKRPKVYYVTQLQTHPPTIGLFVNQPDLFNQNYQRFFLNRLRDELPFSEVPIKLLIRGRDHYQCGREDSNLHGK